MAILLCRRRRGERRIRKERRATIIYATEYVFAAKYAKRELRHGEMARTDRKAGASILNAVDGVNGLRRSKHEEGEKKKLARVWQEAS